MLEAKDFKLYFFYARTDPNKEKIDRIVALSLELAIEYFAERKQMDKYAFLKIYEVESE
jgi:hypothetical protein